MYQTYQQGVPQAWGYATLPGSQSFGFGGQGGPILAQTLGTGGGGGGGVIPPAAQSASAVLTSHPPPSRPPRGSGGESRVHAHAKRSPISASPLFDDTLEEELPSWEGMGFPDAANEYLTKLAKHHAREMYAASGRCKQYESELTQLRNQVHDVVTSHEKQTARVAQLEKLESQRVKDWQKAQESEAEREARLAAIMARDKEREAERMALRQEAQQMRHREREREAQLESQFQQLQNQLKHEMSILDQERSRGNSEQAGLLGREKERLANEFQIQLDQERERIHKSVRSKVVENERRVEVKVAAGLAKQEKTQKAKEAEQEKQMADLKGKVREKTLETKMLKQRLQDVQAKSEHQGRREMENSRSEVGRIAQLEVENERMRGEIRQQESQCEELQRQVESAQNVLICERAEKQRLRDDLTDARGGTAAPQSTLIANLERERASLEGKVLELQRTVRHLQTDLQAKQAKAEPENAPPPAASAAVPERRASGSSGVGMPQQARQPGLPPSSSAPYAHGHSPSAANVATSPSSGGHPGRGWRSESSERPSPARSPGAGPRIVRPSTGVHVPQMQSSVGAAKAPAKKRMNSPKSPTSPSMPRRPVPLTEAPGVLPAAQDSGVTTPSSDDGGQHPDTLASHIEWY